MKICKGGRRSSEEEVYEAHAAFGSLARLASAMYHVPMHVSGSGSDSGTGPLLSAVASRGLQDQDTVEQEPGLAGRFLTVSRGLPENLLILVLEAHWP